MKENIKKSSCLDQYYTKSLIAEKCLSVLKRVINTSIIFGNSIFLEPSAGTGVFIDAIYKVFCNKEIVAYDIEPKNIEIVKNNFWVVDLSEYSNIITVGNPPFGNRSSMAIEFFNKAAVCSSVIAFIVSVQ